MGKFREDFNKELSKKKYYITCIKLDEKEVQVREVKVNKVNDPELMKIKDIIKKIDDEKARFYVAFEKDYDIEITNIHHWGDVREIHTVNDLYIRSNPNDTTKDNVINLPGCF